MKKNHLALFITFLIYPILSIAEPSSPFNNLSTQKTEPTKTPFKQLKNRQESNTSVVYDLNQTIKELKTQLTNKNTPILHKVHDKTFLKRFYRQNNYKPLWISEKGLSSKADALLRAVESDITVMPKSKIHDEYLFLSKYMKNKNLGKDQLTIEVELSQLYLDLLRHRLYGKINWKEFSKKLASERRKRISGNWITVKATHNLTELMLQQDINATLHKITPKNFGYNGLLKSLQKLKELQAQGGWEELPKFKRLALGDEGDNVIKLRERLKQSGDLESCEKSSDKLFESDKETAETITFQPEAIFDECLDTAVRKFQRRHGLEEDGIVGKGTRSVMNETVESKIQKVLLNLDRIKWLPRDLEERYLEVNIPKFMLRFVENQETKEEIRVIVGDKKHRTPIFNDKISFIVLNPYWKVPEGIVRREIIPAMVKNPNYLRKQGLEIHTTWSESSPKIDPSWLYWEDYYHGYEKFPYRIMQPPGSRNALGKIKFKFPNRFDVYLHDTPTKHLFKRTERAFSHGCVRVSEPIKLFETISTFNDIDLQRSKKILKGKRQRQINIQNKLPIHFIYLTAGYNTVTGESLFTQDIYRYDILQNVDKY